jgi:hypothetical protein
VPEQRHAGSAEREARRKLQGAVVILHGLVPVDGDVEDNARFLEGGGDRVVRYVEANEGGVLSRCNGRSGRCRSGTSRNLLHLRFKRVSLVDLFVLFSYLQPTFHSIGRVASPICRETKYERHAFGWDCLSGLAFSTHVFRNDGPRSPNATQNTPEKLYYRKNYMCGRLLYMWFWTRCADLPQSGSKEYCAQLSRKVDKRKH